MRDSLQSLLVGVGFASMMGLIVMFTQGGAGKKSATIVSQTEVYTKSLLTVRHDDHLFVVYSGIEFIHHPSCRCLKGDGQ